MARGEARRVGKCSVTALNACHKALLWASPSLRARGGNAQPLRWAAVANCARPARAAARPVLVKPKRARLALERTHVRSIASSSAGVCSAAHSIVPNRCQRDNGSAPANVARRAKLALAHARVRRVASSSAGVRSAAHCIVPNRRQRDIGSALANVPLRNRLLRERP